MKKIISFSCVWALIAFCHFSAAQSLDLQREIYRSEKQNEEYRLVLGAPKKINDTWVVSRERRLHGDTLRHTYELDSGINTLTEAWALVTEAFNYEQGRELFTCSGLDCGSSNTWANNLFGIKQLYGLDQSQRYAVLDFSEPKRKLLVIYLVQRGNKRIYLQVDEIFPKEMDLAIAADPAVILNELERKGYVVINVDTIDKVEMDAHVDALIKALQRKPFQKYFVVGHVSSSRTSSENFKLAGELSRRFKTLLLEQGIKAERLEEFVAGDALPREGRSSERVEIVLKK